ncbi:unnamed protein product [Paramecium octaurelia]|uniref:Uncharacterized protein n=1 Tax=Paramecium octaurelia TaxID=43137 RepID=A0A8S1RXQ5_PAROT|nr:unnamed protein product [Paramecium octaurelia]
MLQVERILRPRKSISKSLILQQQEPLEQDNTGKAKEHFNHIRQKLKVIHQAGSPSPSPKEENQKQQPCRRDKKGKKLKQQKPAYQLDVSDINSSITDESFDDDAKNQFLIAKENLKKLSKQPNQNKNVSSFTNSPLQQQQGKNDSLPIESQQGIENQFDQEKININFVKSLEHNMDSKNIQESYEDGYLNIHILSDDLQTFLRYEHEVQEMIHRSQQFVNNKQVHEGLSEELENYEFFLNRQKLEREQKQKEFVQRIILQEQQKQNVLQRAKTKKIDDIANKFIDHRHIDLKNDPLNQAHLSRRKKGEQQ